MRRQFLASRTFEGLKLLLGTAIGLVVACLMGYFVFGPKGILYGIAASVAFLSGQLFLKNFRPR
jgi:hypothetical protein